MASHLRSPHHFLQPKNGNQISNIEDCLDVTNTNDLTLLLPTSPIRDVIVDGQCRQSFGPPLQPCFKSHRSFGPLSNPFSSPIFRRSVVLIVVFNLTTSIWNINEMFLKVNKGHMCRLWNIAMQDYQESVTTWQTHRRTPDKVIPMCRYASQATQKLNQKSLTILELYWSILVL